MYVTNVTHFISTIAHDFTTKIIHYNCYNDYSFPAYLHIVEYIYIFVLPLFFPWLMYDFLCDFHFPSIEN